MTNKLMRRIMLRYVKKYGQQDTRKMIAKFAKLFILRSNEFQAI